MMNRRTILESVIGYSQSEMSPELARYLLSLNFPPIAQARYAALQRKAQGGPLAMDERSELEDFLLINDFLTITQGKARAELRRLGLTTA